MQGALGAMTRGVVSAVLARAERVTMTVCEGEAHEIAVDLEAGPSGAPTEPAPADSEKKNDT
jgi:uncharacterized protein YwbE